MITDDSLFHLSSTFAPLLHGSKITRLKKIHVSTRKSYLSEGNLGPVSRNTLGDLLLDTMYDSPARFTILTNIISSNPIPHMVNPYLLVPIH